MSDGETFITVVSFIAAGALWVRWYAPLLSVRWPPGRRPPMLFALAAPPVCLFALALLLRTFAASDVRDAPQYMMQYIAMGAAWIGLGVAGLEFLGLSARDDLAERANVGAGVAVVGGIVGLTLAFAGANFGEGPGWWVVVISAAVSTAALLAALLFVEAAANVVEQVTIDRDLAAGWRLAMFQVACGLVAGRAAAGNWVSTEATLRDFVDTGWLILALAAVEAVVGRAFLPAEPMRESGLIVRGVAPGLLYLVAAGLYVASLGWW